jgi:FkbM family methyltransferase
LFFRGKQQGYYIDIGANDGVSGSTTYWCEQLGWQGICVEPLPSMFEVLKKHRKCTLINAAISDKKQESAGFIEFPDRETRSGLADTYDSTAYEQNLELSRAVSIKVPTIAFGDLDAPTHIDFLSIDTEGHEFPIIQGIDFGIHTFDLITIETKDALVIDILKQNGYCILFKLGEDIMFVNERLWQ